MGPLWSLLWGAVGAIYCSLADHQECLDSPPRAGLVSVVLLGVLSLCVPGQSTGAVHVGPQYLTVAVEMAAEVLWVRG